MADIWKKIDDLTVDFYLEHPIVHLNPSEKYVQDRDGNRFGYEKCLLATGGNPRQLAFGADQILYYRTFADYEKLKQMVNEGGEFAVIGGGFIGAEITAALCMNGQQVSIIFPETGIGANLFPADLAQFLNEVYRQKGVAVINGNMVEELEANPTGKYVLKLDNGQDLEVDHVVAGLGIHPDTTLAENAGLVVDNGIVVDNFLQTSAPDIYAAGDVAAFLVPGLNQRIRVEHADNANTMGRVAGHNLAGKVESYQYLPMFYSDLFEYGYEAVGKLNAALKTFSNWQEPYHRGVVFYLEANKVSGVLLWNVWDKVGDARVLIESAAPHTESELKDISETLLA